MENQKKKYNLRSRARNIDVIKVHRFCFNRRFQPVETERKIQTVNLPETLEETYDPFCDDETPVIKIGKKEPKDPKDRPIFREFWKRSEKEESQNRK